jgi:hypothetical protein
MVLVVRRHTTPCFKDDVHGSSECEAAKTQSKINVYVTGVDIKVTNGKLPLD